MLPSKLLLNRLFLRSGVPISFLVLFLALSANTAGSAPTLFAGLEAPNPDPELSLATEVDDWHKDAVVYHLWVAAFRDSDGDGIGDLKGITQSLDVLKDLGINAIWLSPFFESASRERNLHGYDVTDHYRVDPRLGTNADADQLIREAHERGIRLIFDFVPNHLSSRHPWFVESQDPESDKRDWFLWRDEQPEEGWTGFDRRSDWHEHNDDFYYGIFWGGMPDVNHRNAEIRLELAQAAQHWLDRGFDGIRMDAVRYLYEDMESEGRKSDLEDQPETIAWFDAWRREIMDPYTELGYAKFMVAENWVGERDELMTYLRRDGRPVFHMTLNFPLLQAFTRLDAEVARESWKWDAKLPSDSWLGNFVSNHDLAADRPGTLFADEPQKIRAQAAWLLLSPGTPFVYYGNEIGQPQGQQRGDTKHRQPLNWEEVNRQRQDADSVWRWHQELIQLRHEHPSLRRGKAQFLETDAGPNVLVVWREVEGNATLTMINGSAEEHSGVKVKLPQEALDRTVVSKLGTNKVGGVENGTLRMESIAPFSSTLLHFAE